MDAIGVITASPAALTDKNLYAYCDNNPVMRTDFVGAFWESIWDVISLGASIVEVAVNPTDLWAWASLVGDVVDAAVPFFGGLGEAADSIKIISKTSTSLDNVIDDARALKNSYSLTSDMRSATGSYEIVYENGFIYVGKGGFQRAIDSAARYASDTVRVQSIRWKSAPTSRDAFIDEYFMQDRFGFGKEYNTYNKIWSPGKRYLGR